MTKKLSFVFTGDVFLIIFLAVVLVSYYFNLIPSAVNLIVIKITAHISALPVFWDALKSLKDKKISVDLLASVALFVSLIESQYASVIFIGLMIGSARIFSDYTKTRARNAIDKLLKLKPLKANVKRNGTFVEIPVEQVRKGDLVLVDLGERIPVDGVIEKGEAEIDQSSLTGESLAVHKKTGDSVFTSSVVVSGNLLVKAEKIGGETMFAKIINLVEESRKYKAEIATLGQKFSVWYIVLTIVGSAALYLIFKNVGLVLSVLLVSCADDVAVAVPLAFLTSIGHAARHGVIVKGGDFLEALANLKVVVVDKTGTLTKGKLKVKKIIPFNKTGADEVIRIAAVLSSISTHPSAQAIINYAKKKNILIAEPDKFEEYSGKGITAVYKKVKFASGKPDFFKELKIKIEKGQTEIINKEKEAGLNVTLIAQNKKLIGLVCFADEIRPEAAEMFSQLKKLGVEKIVMLTGDNEKIAQNVSAATGIKEYYANLLPEDKIKYLKKYLSKDYKTAMIGDGVNDAAALGLADVSIAMGTIGSDAAIESADIALMKDDLLQVPEVVRIGKLTLKIARQDIWIWGIVNSIGLVLVFSGILGPSGAAAYNFLTDFIPLANSLRLFK